MSDESCAVYTKKTQNLKRYLAKVIDFASRNIRIARCMLLAHAFDKDDEPLSNDSITAIEDVFEMRMGRSLALGIAEASVRMISEKKMSDQESTWTDYARKLSPNRSLLTLRSISCLWRMDTDCRHILEYVSTWK